MVNGGHYPFTFRWLIIYFVWLLFNLMTIIQADQQQCHTSCHLMIRDVQEKYGEFEKLTMDNSIKAIFFHLKTVNQSSCMKDIYNANFVWIKNRYSQPILTLPISSALMSFNLNKIFTHTLSINLTGELQECYKMASTDCRKEITFKTLIDFTQINHTCQDDDCSTICQRNFFKEENFLGTNIHASCCKRSLVNPQINITECLSNNVQSRIYVTFSTLFIIILSFCLAGIAFNKLVNWLLSGVQR